MKRQGLDLSLGKLTKSILWTAALMVAGLSVQAEETALKRMYDIRVPMRDGVELSTDIVMPAAEGKYPIILIRTPYDNAAVGTSVLTADGKGLLQMGDYFAKNGYAFVVQDTRGRGDSDGEFNYQFPEGEDGYDTIEWLAGQLWADGGVCTMGVSYLSKLQWLAARELPPHLKCMAPTDAGLGPMEPGYVGGAFKARRLGYFVVMGGRTMQSASAAAQDWDKIYRHRPLIEADSLTGWGKLKHYRNFLKHNTLDDYWLKMAYSPEDYKKVNIPILQVTNWFYEAHTSTQLMWKEMHEYNGTNDDHFLIVGPWTHIQSFMGGGLKLGELSFTPDSIIDTWETHLRFFDRYLKGKTDKFVDHKVQVYLTGANEWRYYDSYPAPGTESVKFYMGGEGPANSLYGAGTLGGKAKGKQKPDHFTFDPKRPIVYAGTEKGDIGSDQRPYERRDDMLVYTSEALAEPLEVLGNVKVELYAASSAKDTDFTASLVDVYPDGRAVVMGTPQRGIIRARFRGGMEKEVLLTPGKAEKYTIDLGHVGHVFRPGHKIRLDVSSSAFPYFTVNPNTGNPIATDTAEPIVAEQTVYHDKKRPSALILPVLPGK